MSVPVHIDAPAGTWAQRSTQSPAALCSSPRPALDEAAAATWEYPDSADRSFRTYQHALARCALLQNTLVSIPTGYGKTLIAAVVIHNMLRWFPEGHVVFMAPTRPL
eukprot:2431934-Pleurochrysis_carterae.AAC.1